MTEETIFLNALEKQNPTERVAYLDAVCAGNAELRDRVEALLRTHDDSGNVLDQPITDAPAKWSGATQTFTPPPIADRMPNGSELAILGPPREPGSLGSLDHYEVLELVGRGGMGVVFKARDTKLQRIVAIKVLASHLAADGTSRKRFVREAQAAAAIRDTHVVGIHAVSDDGTVPYLVMEFIGGTTLQEQIKSNGPPALKEILRIGMQAAEGLAAAHRQGLIHRDVKPANLLLENGVQRVKIADFGLARAGDNASLTQSGMIAGTPLYMSPQQARGEELDCRSDLFSLGSVLYFVCTGAAAFAASNTMGVLKRVQEETPRPIRLINSNIPDWFAAIVDKLLAKDPKDRFQSASAVAELCGEHLARLQHSGVLPLTPPAMPRQSKQVFVGLVGLLTLSVLSFAIYVTAIGLPSWHTINDNKDVGLQAPLKDKDLTAIDEPIKGKNAAVTPLESKDRHILTVSQQPADGGEFRTINAALKSIGGDRKVIRVLDAAVYEERIKINRPDQHRGLTLEAVNRKKPTLRVPKDLPIASPNSYCIGINSVANVTLRGFRIDESIASDQVFITGLSSGTTLENLEFVGDPAGCCIAITGLPASMESSPVLIQKCSFRNELSAGIYVSARHVIAPFDKPFACANVVIRNNEFFGMPNGAVALFGAPERVLVVGNRFIDCEAGIDFREFLPGAEEVLVANNTFLRNNRALRVWDQDNQGLKTSKNIRFQNNLVLQPKLRFDLFFFDHRRGIFNNDEKPGDIQGLLKAWRFSHNWREISPPQADEANAKFWIPGPKDTLKTPIEAGYRAQGDLNFLRPPKNSPLATAGADDSILPTYVGAVPPEGVAEWNWDWTWHAFARKLLTVSQKLEEDGRFRTIGEALDKVEPGMTIRVLDGAVYEEHLAIDIPDRHSGVTLEAVGKATIRAKAGKSWSVLIRNVPNLTIRGFRSEGYLSQFIVVGRCSGLLLDRLQMTVKAENGACVEMVNVPLAGEANPIVVRNSTMQNGSIGVIIDGRGYRDDGQPDGDVARPCGQILIQNNTMTRCSRAVFLAGRLNRIQVVGNRIVDSLHRAIDIVDLLPGSSDILIANNTILGQETAVCIWDDQTKGKDFLKCKNIRIQNNLFLGSALGLDFRLLDHRRGNLGRFESGDLTSLLKSPAWRISHNWREGEEPKTDSTEKPFWIPPGPLNKLQMTIDISRKPSDLGYLRPAADSPLAKGGVGNTDPLMPLPTYVGAAPPEKAIAWDWSKTWKAILGKPQ